MDEGSNAMNFNGFPRNPSGSKMRDISFVFLGVAVLVSNRYYAGPCEVLIHSYASNVAVSFAVYFIVLQVPVMSAHKRLWAAGLALAAVELFEIFDGFGIMSNVYDSIDLAANAVGVLLALIVDTALASRKGNGGFARSSIVGPDATKKRHSR